ncbi:hypothetical protein R2F61_06635 [Mollicutes bacterium LVI A0078]|nr:hypothetical protein RZE84_06640 [Mollicutes bacterium LVI A0075]WOO90404.1 hypothetical protein R2F61_06635 [Mollicutes bacterium LVI A0078]
MNVDKLWNFSIKTMYIIGNVILLQVINILLFLIGVFPITIPVIIIINALMIYEFIYANEFYSFISIAKVVKDNAASIIMYVLISFVLITALGMNQAMQTFVMATNVGFFSEIVLLILSVVIFFSLATFLIFFPLVNNSSNQSVMMKIKVTFIIPFFSFKGFIFIACATVINAFFFFSNGLFLIMFGPVLLLAVNIIIFNNYVINKEEK